VSLKQKDEYATGLLVNGAHHARELGSVQFVCYQLLRVIYEYELEKVMDEIDKPYTQLLSNHALYFLPVVNIEGHRAITESYQKTHRLEYYRKNM